MSEQATAGTAQSKVECGRFFAVDRRAWHFVCSLGMNPSIAYLVMARGTGRDNRTTLWSTNAIEKRTNISRSRADAAIRALEQAGAVLRDPASKPSHPRYKLLPAHEIRGCKGFPPTPLEGAEAEFHARLGDKWTPVPDVVSPQDGEWKRWGTCSPRDLAWKLVGSDHAERRLSDIGAFYRSVHYDTGAAAQPDWIWLPNALIDDATDETPPVERIRQTGSAATLRLLVDLYGAHLLDENGGIDSRHVGQSYDRHKVGERGSYDVYGFEPAGLNIYHGASFIAPFFGDVGDGITLKNASQEFWSCWHRLQACGLVEFVAHLFDSSSLEAEIVHPVALPGTGLAIERELADAASKAASGLLTRNQRKRALRQGCVTLVPVYRHIEGVQMRGVARLRYKPQTTRTQAFMARETKWRAEIKRLHEIALRYPSSTCNIKVVRDIKEDQSESRWYERL